MVKLSKLLKIKGVGFILLAFAAGVILLLMPTGSEEVKSDTTEFSSYATRLKVELEELLENATGRKCSVMLSFETGYSYVYAVDERLDTSYGDKGMTSKSVSKEYVTVTKDGREAPVIIKETPPQVKGVAIVCKKGTEVDRENIISTVVSLFDLSYESVSCIVASDS